MAIKVYPYRQGSQSARRLAEALGGRVLKREGSKYSPRLGDIIINWGDSQCPLINTQARVLNHPHAIRRASNKKDAFLVMKEAGVSVPSFAISIQERTWEVLTVVRHKLTGHSGDGIEIVEPGGELPEAPLYVQYVKKKDEYRIHIVGESITTIQRKAARKDFDGTPNWRVRNHSNGFVFVRKIEGGGAITPPQQVLEQASLAIKALELDFGAVDVIWNEQEQRAYVLEVNTAPGMEGSTVTEYADGFKSLLEVA